MGIRSFETRRPSIALVRVEAPRGPQGHGACARTPRCCCFRGPRPGLSPSPPLYDALCLLPGWRGCGSGPAWGSGVRRRQVTRLLWEVVVTERSDERGACWEARSVMVRPDAGPSGAGTGPRPRARGACGVRGGRGSRRPLCGFPDVMAAPGGLFANPHCLGAFETISPELVRRPRKKLNIVLGQRGPREGYESLEPVTIQGPRDSQSLWRGHQGHAHVPGADGRQAPRDRPPRVAPRAPPRRPLARHLRRRLSGRAVAAPGDGGRPSSSSPSSSPSTGSPQAASFITILQSVKADEEGTCSEPTPGSSPVDPGAGEGG